MSLPEESAALLVLGGEISAARGTLSECEGVLGPLGVQLERLAETCRVAGEGVRAGVEGLNERRSRGGGYWGTLRSSCSGWRGGPPARGWRTPSLPCVLRQGPSSVGLVRPPLPQPVPLLPPWGVSPLTPFPWGHF